MPSDTFVYSFVLKRTTLNYVRKAEFINNWIEVLIVYIYDMP